MLSESQQGINGIARPEDGTGRRGGNVKGRKRSKTATVTKILEARVSRCSTARRRKEERRSKN